MRGLPWRLLLTTDEDAPVYYSQSEWNAIAPEERQRILQNAARRAAENRGFIYYTYPMIEAYLKGEDPGNPIHQITEYVNSPDFMNIIRQIMDQPGLTKAEAHACEYRPGHYLTRHIDEYGGDHEGRQAAYVLGFSKNWQPDWGGLLLFLKENQDIESGFLPRFNNLTIFSTRYLHTVTQVSTFAAEPRHTITGWFRND